jgi:hypothetical protein
VNDLLSDPWVAAEIERALAPYAGRLPAEQIEWMREQLVETLLTESKAAQLLSRARPRHSVDESGAVRRDHGADVPDSKRSSKAG